MVAIPLGAGPEFDRIRAIVSALGPRAAALGNDVAWISLGGAHIAISTDISVEGVHFRRQWLSLEEIGWRAAAAALSDLAAAGATVIGVVTALTVPGDEGAAATTQLMQGVDAAVESVGGMVLGGDLSRGETLSLAVTVLGTAERRMSRAGATPGDGLWVTGSLGGARAALAAWTAGREPAPAARARFSHPEPRLDWGRWLVGQGATAMLDLSDGIAGDAGHLAAASGVGLTIALESLPLHPAVAAEARTAGEEPAVFAAEGGEDYELLVAMPPEFSGSGAVYLTRVGSVVPGVGASFEVGGRRVELSGYNHFA
jgi:thiamine-monophosphate kinase